MNLHRVSISVCLWICSMLTRECYVSGLAWGKMDSMEAVGSVTIDESRFQRQGLTKRSMGQDRLVPGEIVTRITGGTDDITLKFRKQSRLNLPRLITSSNDNTDMSTLETLDGEQCIWLYEDEDNDAFTLVDFCHRTNKLQMMGEVFINGEKHLLLPDDHTHTLFRCQGNPDFFGASVKTDGTNTTTSSSKGRHRRQTFGDNVLELMLYIDNSVYNFFYNFNDESGLTASQRRLRTLAEIRTFYSFLVQGMNNRYRTISTASGGIQIKVVAIKIQETPNELSSQTDASLLLTLFTSYITQQKMNDANFPIADHYMLITSLDLILLSNSRSVGLAYQNGTCSFQSTSVVEDRFSFLSEAVFSHELAHSLGAMHDGQQNACLEADGYIMAALSVAKTGSRAQNMWRFSECSKQEIRQFVDNLNSNNNNCMRTLNAPDATTPSPQASPLGQVYTPDEQCKRRLTSVSQLARIEYFETGFGGICTGMRCTTSTNSLVLVVPADGTSCGNGQWCESGQCVNSNSAPAKDESCLFGDQPGEVTPGNTCDRLLSFLGQCYRDNVRFSCCGSCEARKLPLAGCEYGDRLNCSQVQPLNCYDEGVKADCCKTCNDFIKTGLPDSCQYGDKNTGCVPGSCTDNPFICCETCKDDPRVTGVTKENSKLPDWVIPTAAVVGGIVLLGLIIGLVCCLAKSRANKTVKKIERINSRRPAMPQPARGVPVINRVPEVRYYAQPRNSGGVPIHTNGAAGVYARPEGNTRPMTFNDFMAMNANNPGATETTINATPNGV